MAKKWFRCRFDPRVRRKGRAMRRHSLCHLVRTLVCLAVLVASIGCGDRGPKFAPVRGKITYKGKLVPQGTVMFQPEDGPAAVGAIKDGEFVLKTDKRNGAVLGKHRVTIISLQDQSSRLPEQRN